MGGLIAYLVTPLAADGGAVRFGQFVPYVDALLERCTPAGFACLANDFAYFTDDERRRIASAAIKAVGRRAPVDVCTSAISTVQAIELGKHAEGEGAARVIVNPQSYIPLEDDQIVRHYEQIANSLRIPVHIYNNPVSTRNDMPVGLLRRIVDATGARSIKEAGSRVEKFQDLRAEFGDTVTLHVGFHYMALGGFALGATAWDAGLAPCIAAPCERLFHAAVTERDTAAAQKRFDALLPLFQFFREKGALASIKALAAMDGIDLGGTRSPVEMLTAPDLGELRRRLARASDH